jgi:hypothetical protein
VYLLYNIPPASTQLHPASASTDGDAEEMREFFHDLGLPPPRSWAVLLLGEKTEASLSEEEARLVQPQDGV